MSYGVKLGSNSFFKSNASWQIQRNYEDFAIWSQIWKKFATSTRQICTNIRRLEEIYWELLKYLATSQEKILHLTNNSFSTKVRYRFLQYIANKPDKFRIKFWLCADVDLKFVLSDFPYLVKDERPQNHCDSVVMRLVEPFANTGRNINTDNFFTSVSLSDNLLAKRTTIVGTMNRVRREIPACV